MTALLISLVFAASPVDHSGGKTLVIRTERVATVTKGVIENGTIVIKNGKIVTISPRPAVPPTAEVINAEKLTAYPGIVLAKTSTGLNSVYGSEKSTVEPGLWPYGRKFDRILRSGVTAMGLTTGSRSLTAPQALVIRPLERKKEELILSGSNFLSVGFSASSKRTLEGRLKQNGPFKDAAEGKINIIITSSDANSTLHLLPVLSQQKRMKKSILQEGDIVNALPHLLKAKIPCILHARMYAEPGTIFERNSAAEIAKANIPLCLLPRTDRISAIESLRFDVARLIKSGLSEKQALRAITIMPAALVGMDWRIGSLEKGKDADILLLNGDIFDFDSRIQRIFIAGEQVFPEPSRESNR